MGRPGPYRSSRLVILPLAPVINGTGWRWWPPRAAVTKARGHFPTDDAVVKLLWLAIINIEDKRARERLARRQQTGKRSDQPARLVEGQRVTGWREALNELDEAYPGRLR